ncbi:MAG: acyl-CoA thioesterase [Leptolyngbyaceae cyanobacterium]
MANRWFHSSFRVQPHHTDYSGVVWHGTYIQWMETARVDCLRTIGVAFEDCVASGYDLPVVDLQMRYRQPLTLGAEGLVKTRLEPNGGIRLTWLYEIYDMSTQPHRLCVTGEVVLVPINMTTRKIARRLPTELQPLLTALNSYFGETDTP